MTDADIRLLAREVDGHMNDRSSGIDLSWESLIKIVRAAIAAEREACAKVCENIEPVSYDTAGYSDCAAAIRARNQQ